jgi:hypothetical protein
MLRRLLALFLFTGISLASLGQEHKKLNARVTLRSTIGIPTLISSRMFRASFTGIAGGNVALCVRLVDNVHFGVGFDATFLRNQDFLRLVVFNANPYQTRFLARGVYLKLGYDRYFSARGYASYSLNGGIMKCSYLNVNPDSSAANKPFGALEFETPYLQPELTLHFLAERALSFSFFISYTTAFSKYDPKAPRFNQFEEINSRKNRYVMSWINFGFGFNIMLSK